jgi:hypothetical protein
MSALACPQCTNPVPEPGPCPSCDLDVSLLFRIRRAASSLAHRAAQSAAEGEWQQAYDRARESLSLARSDNDLAAFVLLLAMVGGAHGTLASVPRPRVEQLPASLAPYADELIAAARALRDGEVGP